MQTQNNGSPKVFSIFSSKAIIFLILVLQPFRADPPEHRAEAD